MSEKYSFLVIKYPKADTAMMALDALRQLSKEKVVKLKDAVAVTKTMKGKIKLHQTKDDTAGKGFMKGGLIGVIFAALFGPAGWIAAGAAIGTAFAMFDRGIKNKLLKELGEKMTPFESAVAILVEHADWQVAVERMKGYNFKGDVVVSEIVEEDMAEVEKLLENEKAVASVPEEMEVPALVEVAAEGAPQAAETAAASVAVFADAGEAAAGPVAEDTIITETEAGMAFVETPAAPAVHRAKGLEYIEGVGGTYSQKLSDAGIKTVEELLERGCTPHGRKAIAAATGISDKLILRWVNMADLYRIKGIGQEYAELLEAAGVDTIPELAQRVPANLLAKMEVANEQRKMVRRLPVFSQVESWVEQAKSLPRIVRY